MKINLNISKKVFNGIYFKYIKAMQYVQIFFGGSSGGKSIFVSDRAVLDIFEGGRNYLVCRNVGKYVRKSVFKEIKKSITKFKLSKHFKINHTDMVITCLTNGYQFVFVGLNDVENLKSITPDKGVFTDLWVEEATETQYNDVKELIRRMRGKSKHPKRVIFTFNPIFKTHWIFKKYFSDVGWQDDQAIHESEDLLILKTTYKDNSFLEDREIKVLQDETDPYHYNVYTLGNWGTLGDVILTNWVIEDFDEKNFDIYNNGLDFGFSNHPTALVRSYHHAASKTLYICEDWECLGEQNPEIAEGIKPIVSDETVICDSAEPKSIAELCREGISAIGANKPKGSVIYGIQWLKQQTIKVKPQCQSTINNLQVYQWRKDKDGNSINEPIKRFDDFIDALRYGNEFNMESCGDAEAVTVGQTQQAGDQW